MSLLQDIGGFMGELNDMRSEIKEVVESGKEVVGSLATEANEVKETLADTATELSQSAAAIKDDITESVSDSLPSDPRSIDTSQAHG